VKELVWLTPGRAAATLEITMDRDVLKANLPPVEAYGVLRLRYID
jgi:hypothetical protein